MAEKGHTFEQAVNPLLQVEPRRSEETQRRATRHRSHRGAAAKCTYVGAALAHHRERESARYGLDPYIWWSRLKNEFYDPALRHQSRRFIDRV